MITHRDAEVTLLAGRMEKMVVSQKTDQLGTIMKYPAASGRCIKRLSKKHARRGGESTPVGDSMDVPVN